MIAASRGWRASTSPIGPGPGVASANASVRPDPAQHPLRQEVRVHVGQARQAERLPEARHGVIDHTLNLRSTGS
jgi:hypothetical protein